MWDRKARGVFAALALIVAASLTWLVHPNYEATVETNDASMYILSAQSILSGQGYGYLGQPFTIRPPGMSMLLAPILAWRGLDFGAMHLLIGLFGAVGVLFLFAWMRPRVGDAVAAALAVFVWLNPGYRHFWNQVMSDVPGMALTIALLLIGDDRTGAVPGRATFCSESAWASRPMCARSWSSCFPRS